jgi:hypothetical protein
MVSRFKNKKELVSFIKQQTNISLPNRKDDFNRKRRVLYTQIKSKDKLTILSFLRRNGARTESHIKDYYWIIF